MIFHVICPYPFGPNTLSQRTRSLPVFIHCMFSGFFNDLEKKEKKEEKKDNQYKLKEALTITIGLIHVLRSPTVACKKLDPLFFLKNSLIIQRRTPKPLAMCFYWPVWHLNSFDLFALLSTLTYLDRHGSQGMISPGQDTHISEENTTTLQLLLP